MLFFKHDSRKLCVDATMEDDSMGRLINHSITHSNLRMKVVVVERGNPQVVFVASKTIYPGNELLYDYGERRKTVLEENPWLKE